METEVITSIVGAMACARVTCLAPRIPGQVDLQLCSNCKAVAYCSEDCHTGDWAGHKSLCAKMKGATWDLKVKLMSEMLGEGEKTGNSNKSKARKKKSTYSDNEKEIFLNIMKTSEGGRFWKTIVEGKGGSNSNRHDVWLKVTQIFNTATGREADWEQMKAMWTRIKKKMKEKHDSSALNRDFKKSCAETGGGPSPMLPPQADGDDLDFDLDDKDPTPTSYNQLVRPQERPSITSILFSGPPSAAPSPARASSPTVGPAFRFPGNSIPVRFPTPGRERAYSPNIRLAPAPSERSPISCNPPSSTLPARAESSASGITPLGVSACQPELSSGILYQQRGSGSVVIGEGEAMITDESGEHLIVNVHEEPVPEHVTERENITETPRVKRKIDKREMTEAAANYYDSMLDIQKKLAEKKMKVLESKQRLLKRKEENEAIRGKILKKAFKDGDGDDHDAVSVADGFDDSEERDRDRLQDSEEEDNDSDSSSEEERNVVPFFKGLKSY